MSSASGSFVLGMPQGSYEGHQPVSQTQGNLTAVDIIVYFSENSGLHLKVVDGQNATASDLFEMVMDEQKYSEEARELFSLWLVSDLLELQLKPTHIPFKLVCYWEELLEKYTSASQIERHRDEPVIMFRRNVFCSCEVEKRILDTENDHMLDMLRLLYNEAKKNVLMGRYPLLQNECDKLAGIQAFIVQREHGEMLTIKDFKSRMTDYLPKHFCKRRWLSGTKDNPEYRLMNSYTTQAEELQDLDIENLYRRYIEKCQEKPYYGCAFFRGQVEHPGHRMVTVDDPVFVAINLHGVYIIDEDDFVMLIGLPYKFLCWERAESNEQSTESLPFLVLQFPAAALENQYSNVTEPGDTSLFQIFSKQTPLMDKLIEACIELRKSGSTMIDSGAERKIITGHSDIAKQFQRLALRTYNQSYELIKDNVRKPK